MADIYRPLQFPDGSGGWDTVGDPRLGDHVHPATDISDSTALGRTLMAVADAGAGRDALGIEVDTSVGTRVFIGDVMVHNDTGWRLIVGWSGGVVTTGEHPSGIGPEGNSTGGIYLLRQGTTISFAVVDGVVTADNPTMRLPIGFRGNDMRPYPAVMIPYRTGTDAHTGQAEVGANQIRLRLPEGSRLSAAGTGGYGVMATWTTTLDWPTSLPGTPA